jgi:hypothetical protein
VDVTIDSDGNGSMFFFGWGDSIDYDTGDNLSVDSWHHIVATYDGSTVRTYLDGKATPTTGQSRNLSTGLSPLYVGTRMDNSRYADIIADDVRIYDKSLSDSEVENWYKSGRIDEGVR